MRTERYAAVAIAVLAALCNGCASVRVSPDDAFQRESAYIYGSFGVASDDNISAAFSIRCRDGRRYKIEFSKDQPLKVIRLPPGVCQLDDVIYRGVGSVRQMASMRLLGNEHLQPGGVYYVGDFVVTGGTVSSEWTPFVGTTVTQVWGPFSPRNNYARTTTALKRQFPLFARVPTEDRMPRQ
jgi:hypothetical protein